MFQNMDRLCRKTKGIDGQHQRILNVWIRTIGNDILPLSKNLLILSFCRFYDKKMKFLPLSPQFSQQFIDSI